MPEPLITWKLREAVVDCVTTEQSPYMFVKLYLYRFLVINNIKSAFALLSITPPNNNNNREKSDPDPNKQDTKVAAFSFDLEEETEEETTESDVEDHEQQEQQEQQKQENKSNGGGAGEGKGEGEGEEEEEEGNADVSQFSSDQILHLKRLLLQLPSRNFQILKYLIGLFSHDFIFSIYHPPLYLTPPPTGFLNTIPTFETNKMSEENVSIIFGPLIIGQGPPAANGMPPDVSGPAAVVAAMLGSHTGFVLGEESTSEGWVKKYIE